MLLYDNKKHEKIKCHKKNTKNKTPESQSKEIGKTSISI